MTEKIKKAVIRHWKKRVNSQVYDNESKGLIVRDK